MINNLEKQDLNCNIFSAYDYDGMTINELLCQFFTKINECIDVSNKTNSLAQWLVNEGLNEEVARKLELWVVDGTLEGIINDDLFSSLNTEIKGIGEKTNTTYEQLFNRICYVSDFGAIGDGISDDTLPLQKAFDFLQDKPNSKLIFEKNKTYLIDTTLCIKGSNLHIEGNNSTLITTNPSIGIMLLNGTPQDKFVGYEGNSNITVSNLNFIGYRDRTSTAIAFAHAKNIRIDNCMFTNFVNHCMDMAGLNGLLVTDCKFFGHSGVDNLHNECIQLDYCLENSFGIMGTYDGTVTKNVVIERCEFKPSSEYKAWSKCVGGHTFVDGKIYSNVSIRNCTMECTESAVAFYNTIVDTLNFENNMILSQSDVVTIITPPKTWKHETTTSRNINVIGNDIYMCDIFLNVKSDQHSLLNINVDRNLINHKGTSIQIRDISNDKSVGISNINVINNKCYGKGEGSCGLYLDNVRSGVISNNIITDTTLDGMLLDSCQLLNINNNTIQRVIRYGLNAKNTRYTKISSNKFYNMKTYGLLCGYGNSANVDDVVITDNIFRGVGTYEPVSGLKRAIGVFNCNTPIINNNSIINTDNTSVGLPDCYIYVDENTTEPMVANNTIYGKCSGSNEHIVIASSQKYTQNNLVVQK